MAHIPASPILKRCHLSYMCTHPERLELLVKVAVQGSQSPQPHLEDGTTYYPLRPTWEDSNRPLRS